MTLRGRFARLSLALVLVASAAVLLWQGPFAFYSPDVAYHASRIQRSSEGEYFTCAFSGTLTIYPGLFHFLWGRVKALSGIDAFLLVRLASAINVVGVFGAFYLLAREALEDGERAAAAALSLGLVLFAPTGRYLLLANPVNVSLILLFAGLALLWRFLRAGALLDWTLALLLIGLAANLNWYQGLAAAGVLLALLPRLVRERRLSWRAVGLGALAVAVPSAWTVVHIWTIRSVLPAYFSRGGELIPWTVGLSIVQDWVVTYATHWNLKFLPQMWRSPAATVLYLGVVVPATVLLLLLPAGLALRRRACAAPGSRDLLLAAALVFAASLVMTMTRDLGRVAWIQFVSFALLLLYAWRVLDAALPARAVRATALAAAIGGTACLAYTALHSGQRFDGGLTSSTRAVVDFIAALPDHPHTRIFVPESDLRRLTPFVAFTSFVNHRSGLYASQDPVSAETMLRAYRSILAHDADAQAMIESQQVQWLAFRLRTSDAAQALADSYAAAGSAVALRNREWIVLRSPGPADARRFTTTRGQD